jgi:hypothetical protein
MKDRFNNAGSLVLYRKQERKHDEKGLFILLHFAGTTYVNPVFPNENGEKKS